MPLLRLLFAGLVALFAMVAVLFTAVVIFFTGLVGWVLQIFRPRRKGAGPGPARPVNPETARRGPVRAGDVIDIEATPVPDKPAGRLP
jgi:chromate transport protein ChrA